MYTAHFGLSAPPFAITPDPRFLYMSDRHREGLAHLLYGIRQPGGFVQLTGEVGTGKTTLCRCLLEQLPPEVDVALVLNPQVTPTELLATLCDELAITYPIGSQSVKSYVDALHRYLLKAHARGRRTVLIVDEAQNLPPDVLEQIRLLTNLETATEKLLQIILIGQPELIRILERPQLRQLAQRITARYHLQPFAFRDTAAYVSHRLRVGGRKDRLFTPAALREIQRRSGGIPRLVNVLCDRSLLGAFARDAHRIDARVVRRAAREVRGERLHRGRAVGLVWAAGLLLLLGAVAAGWYLAAARGWSPEIPRIPAATVAATAPPPDAARPVEPAPPRPALSELLTIAARRPDPAAPFASLFARWGLDPTRLPSTSADPCKEAVTAGLTCTWMAGNWGRLRRLDLPALLRMEAGNGVSLAVPLVALGPTDATLDLDRRRLTFPLGEVDGLWDGHFMVVWKPPSAARRLLAPGARGADVAWVRARLVAALGSDPGGGPPDLFDQRLGERIRRFQRAQALTDDGVVGEETLFHLFLAAREPGTPTLSTPSP